MVSLAEYRAMRGPAPVRREDPEHQFQVRATRGVRLILPTPVIWTASAAGVRLPPGLARKLKAAGQSPGWADWQFLFPDAKTRYLELKWAADLSPPQIEFRDVAEPMGIWAMARTWDQVWAPLHRWCAETGLELKPLPPVTRLRLGL